MGREHAVVQAAAGQQLLVGAVFDVAAAVQHQDAVGQPRRGGRWVTMMAVRRAAIFMSRSYTACSSSGSIDAVGSSSRTVSCSRNSPRAIPVAQSHVVAHRQQIACEVLEHHAEQAVELPGYCCSLRTATNASSAATS